MTREAPFGASPSSKSGQWQRTDPFLRFWFRFVFPFQGDLEAGLAPLSLFKNEVKRQIADHVAPVFESWCLGRLRRRRQRATRSPWSPRRNGQPARQMASAIDDDLDQFKLAALKDGGLKVAENVRVVLLSRSGYSGYSRALHARTRTDSRVELVDVAAALRPGRVA